MIDIELLKKYGAIEKKIRKGKILFHEGDNSIFYYQIIDGSIKMNNYNSEGQETIQGIFKKGDSMGEPPLFGEFPYPANAEAIENTHLIRLEKRLFFKLLEENPQICIELLRIFSKRLHFKAIISKEIKGHEAEHKIMTLLKYLKEKSGNQGDYCIDITRQTIASMTGLRVETVIKTLKKLEEKHLVSIQKRKIHL